MSWHHVPCLADGYAPAPSLDHFRRDVLSLYPHLSDDLCYSFTNLTDLVHRTQRSGGLTHWSLGSFHRRFLTCSTYLLARGHLCSREQRILYLQGLPTTLRKSVDRRLSIKLPDTLPDDGYPISSILEAATFILTDNRCHSRLRSTSSSASASTCDDVTLQSSRCSSPFASTPVTIHPHPPRLPSGPLRIPVHLPTPGGVAQNTPRREQVCFKSSIKSCRFCGDPSHFIRDCPTATQYLSEGKATRNSDGRISLPNGCVPPRNIPGKNLRERFDNYWIAKGLHRQDQTKHSIISRQSPGHVSNYISVPWTPPVSNHQHLSSVLQEVSNIHEQIQALQSQLKSLREAQRRQQQLDVSETTPVKQSTPVPVPHYQAPTVHNHEPRQQPQAIPSQPMKLQDQLRGHHKESDTAMANQFSDRLLSSPSTLFVPRMLPAFSPSATPRPRMIPISSSGVRSTICTIPVSAPASVSRMAPIYAPTPTYPSNFISSSSPLPFLSSPLSLVYSPSLPTSSPPILFSSRFSSHPIPLVPSPVSSVISPSFDSSPSRSHLDSPLLISFTPSPSSTSSSSSSLFSFAAVSSSSTLLHVTPFVPPDARPPHERSPINDSTIPMASRSLPQGFHTHPRISPSVPDDFESLDGLSFASPTTISTDPNGCLAPGTSRLLDFVSSFPCSPTQQSVSSAFTTHQDGFLCLPQPQDFDPEVPQRMVTTAHLNPMSLLVNSKVDLKSCFNTSTAVSSPSAHPRRSVRNGDLAPRSFSVCQHIAPALRSSDSQHHSQSMETALSPWPVFDHESWKPAVSLTELSVHVDDSQSLSPQLENAADHTNAAVSIPKSGPIPICAEKHTGIFGLLSCLQEFSHHNPGPSQPSALMFLSVGLMSSRSLFPLLGFSPQGLQPLSSGVVTDVSDFSL